MTPKKPRHLKTFRDCRGNRYRTKPNLIMTREFAKYGLTPKRALRHGDPIAPWWKRIFGGAQ